MLTIIIHEDGEIELLHSMNVPPHVVVVDERGEWTNSPTLFEDTTEDDQAEYLANVRNDGFVDRNP